MRLWAVGVASCARAGGGQRRTPTVVKTSWSLFTSVISPGSFTLMLYNHVSFPQCEGPSKHVRTHLGLSPWSAKCGSRWCGCFQYSCVEAGLGVGGIKGAEGESV